LKKVDFRSKKSTLDPEVCKRLLQLQQRIDDLRAQHNVLANAFKVEVYSTTIKMLSWEDFHTPLYGCLWLSQYSLDLKGLPVPPSLRGFKPAYLKAKAKCLRDIKAILTEKYPELKQYVTPKR